MPQYTTILTDVEDKAFSAYALSQQDWIDNVVHERCRAAVEEIVKITIEKCLENNIQIPSSKDEMVILAFEQEWVKTVAQKNAEAEAERAQS